MSVRRGEVWAAGGVGRGPLKDEDEVVEILFIRAENEYRWPRESCEGVSTGSACGGGFGVWDEYCELCEYWRAGATLGLVLPYETAVRVSAEKLC